MRSLLVRNTFEFPAINTLGIVITPFIKEEELFSLYDALLSLTASYVSGSGGGCCCEERSRFARGTYPSNKRSLIFDALSGPVARIESTSLSCHQSTPSLTLTDEGGRIWERGCVRLLRATGDDGRWTPVG